MCSGCGTAQVLGIPRQEAADLLKKGDTGFILSSALGLPREDFSGATATLKQLALIHPAAAFYAGLLIEDTHAGSSEAESPGGRDVASLLFCAALDSPSLPASREAARKLISKVLGVPAPPDTAAGILGFLDSDALKESGRNHLLILRAACLYSRERYDEVPELLSAISGDEWGKALTLFAEWKSPGAKTGGTEKLKQELLGFLFGLPRGEIRAWAYGEALSLQGLLNPEESAVISGRLSPDNFGVLLSGFRSAVLLDGGTIFFRYPELLADFGRAYQFTPAMRGEGIELFRSWNALLKNPGRPPEETFTLPSSFPGNAGAYREIIAFAGAMDDEAKKRLSYNLLFYLGRMERAGEKYNESSEYFTLARELAPDGLQSDACLWHVLSNAMARAPAAPATLTTSAALVLDTMPQWNDVSYFADILDRLSCYLAGRRQWENMYKIFSALESRTGEGAYHNGASLAQYAWILGRAEQEGYFKTQRSAEDFFRVAFEEGNWSFYYRAMAASKLGETFAPEKDNTETGKNLRNTAPGEETEFLLGFFTCGAASFAPSYIQAAEKDLAVASLRKIAEAMASSLRWKESLDLVSRYTGREDYKLSRADLRLFYPRPFLELTEKYAKEAELGAEILFGLIRTESYFMPGIVSRSGAVGLTQLMIPTARDMAGRMARRGLGDYRDPDSESLKDPEQNIHIGSYYLSYLTEQMGNPMLALLAYNGGMGRLRRWLAADRQKDGGLPRDLFLETIEFNETREYGRRVLAAAAVYGYLYYGMTMEAVAADIYRAD